MSVIIVGMNMPKHCYDCPVCYDYMGCSITGNGLDWENCDKVRLEDCPSKSIDGLIKEIKNIDLDKTTNDFYGMQKKVIEVVKEYCEVKE